MAKKIHTKDLLAKIEKLTKERMAQADVVDFAALKKLKNTKAPTTILVIEDDESMRLALRRIFEAEGYRVVAASDGTHLSQVLDDTPIDLILLDVGLPWINGYELAEMMKAHSDLKHIPLVFVSGRTSETDMKKGFQVGADDFITKPFDVEKLKKTVKTLLTLASV